MYKRVVDTIIDNQIDYVVTVPCKEFAPLLRALQLYSEVPVIFPQREDEGLALMLGLELSQKRCLGIFQDTLLGNSQNILGVVSFFTDVPLRVWLGARTGNYLDENPVHKFITDHHQEFLVDPSFEVLNLFINRGQKTFLPSQINEIEYSLKNIVNERLFLIWHLA